MGFRCGVGIVGSFRAKHRPIPLIFGSDGVQRLGECKRRARQVICNARSERVRSSLCQSLAFVAVH